MFPPAPRVKIFIVLDNVNSPGVRGVIDLDQWAGIFMDVLMRVQKLALFQGMPAEKLKALADVLQGTESEAKFTRSVSAGPAVTELFC